MSTQSNGVDMVCTTLPGSLTCLTRENTAGLSMAVAASLLSLGSVLYAFFFFMVNAHRQTSTVFQNSMDILIFALLFADLAQAVGGMLSLKWIRDGKVQVGMTCDAQGVLQTFGETGVALTTLLVAIYTFVGVSTGRGLKSMKTTAALVVLIWVFVGALIGVGHSTQDPSKPRYMSPVPFWCWVGSDLTWKIVTEYLWMWISLFVSCLLYIPLYLWMRGNLVFHESVWYRWSFQKTPSDSDSRSTRRKALVMLLYPIVYCICILPLSIVRWITFDDEAKYGVTNMPPEYTFAVITIFGLSGFLNVMLVFTTKPNLGLFGHAKPLGRPPSPAAIDRLRRETELEVVGRPDAIRYNKQVAHVV